MKTFVAILYIVMIAILGSGCSRNPPHPHAIAPLEAYASRCITDLDELERDHHNNLLVCSALVEKEFNARPIPTTQDPIEVFFEIFTDHAYTIEEVQHSPCAPDLTELTYSQLNDCYNMMQFMVRNS